ncbi:Uncharacterised protein [Serratia plymuthica]|nr:Uncharacterised protein [Serratia plymuthica]VEI20074.1 Uncharacterised protein [Serratia plymuthica]
MNNTSFMLILAVIYTFAALFDESTAQLLM